MINALPSFLLLFLFVFSFNIVCYSLGDYKFVVIYVNFDSNCKIIVFISLKYQCLSFCYICFFLLSCTRFGSSYVILFMITNHLSLSLVLLFCILFFHSASRYGMNDICIVFNKSVVSYNSLLVCSSLVSSRFYYRYSFNLRDFYMFRERLLLDKYHPKVIKLLEHFKFRRSFCGLYKHRKQYTDLYLISTHTDFNGKGFFGLCYFFGTTFRACGLAFHWIGRKTAQNKMRRGRKIPFIRLKDYFYITNDSTSITLSKDEFFFMGIAQCEHFFKRFSKELYRMFKFTRIYNLYKRVPFGDLLQHAIFKSYWFNRRMYTYNVWSYCNVMLVSFKKYNGNKMEEYMYKDSIKRIRFADVHLEEVVRNFNDIAFDKEFLDLCGEDNAYRLILKLCWQIHIIRLLVVCCWFFSIFADCYWLSQMCWKVFDYVVNVGIKTWKRKTFKKHYKEMLKYNKQLLMFSVVNSSKIDEREKLKKQRYRAKKKSK